MSFLSRLESRFGRWAIPNLTMLLIVGQAVLYLAQLTGAGGNNVFSNLYLLPGKVLEGEVWRLVTFLFIPPLMNPLFVIFYFLLFNLFGTSLENYWGTFRYNVFLGIGWLANVAAAFVAYAWLGMRAEAIGMPQELFAQSLSGSNTFLYGTIFLAFARLCPDFVINVMFILPIQIKWLALLAWIGYGYALATGDAMSRMMVVASIVNYLVFFGREHWRDLKHGQRRRSFQSRAKSVTKSLVHECRVCGLNSEGAPKVMFRYCSKCAGQCCYCPDHIQDHEHVTEAGETASEAQSTN